MKVMVLPSRDSNLGLFSTWGWGKRQRGNTDPFVNQMTFKGPRKLFQILMSAHSHTHTHTHTEKDTHMRKTHTVKGCTHNIQRNTHTERETKNTLRDTHRDAIL